MNIPLVEEGFETVTLFKWYSSGVTPVGVQIPSLAPAHCLITQLILITSLLYQLKVIIMINNYL